MRGEEFQVPTQDITSTHDDVDSRRGEEFGETPKQDNVPFQETIVVRPIDHSSSRINESTRQCTKSTS